ncbi:MAG: hypothetical protein FJ276_12710 [Planctomycetes bacterium]|nr:hypothetical protein [Planctomycetota bacterium]
MVHATFRLVCFAVCLGCLPVRISDLPAAEDTASEARAVSDPKPGEPAGGERAAGAADTSGGSEARGAEPDNPVPALSAAEKELQQRLRRCLAHYLFHPENVAERSPWGAMHSMLPFGVEAELLANNRRVNAIGWLSYDGKCRGQSLFLAKGKSFAMAIGPGVQGHEGQFLAMLAQSQVPRTYPIKVRGRSLTVADLIEYEQQTCRERSELTFKLIALAHYLSGDPQWTCQRGTTWTIGKMVQEELRQGLTNAACGGTHRLMGFSYACRRRAAQGLPLQRPFRDAREFLDRSVDLAFTMQNPDGSFSTEWFKRRGNAPDADRKVQTTGHILEWLAYELPADRMREPEVGRAVRYLLSQIWDRRERNWAIGPRSHALRALVLYDQKVYLSKPGERRSLLAEYAKPERQGTER